MVPDISTGISRVPAYSGGVSLIFRFAYGALTRCGPTFQTVPPASDSLLDAPITPAHALRHRRFGLLPVRSPLLGNRCYFLFLRVLRCFSSPRSPCAIRAMSGSLPTGCPIRTSGGHGAFATRPGFSQLVTSFFASESLGIPMRPSSFRFIFITDLTAISKRGLKSDFCSPLVCSFL